MRKGIAQERVGNFELGQHGHTWSNIWDYAGVRGM
jgi:hypothetical protein